MRRSLFQKLVWGVLLLAAVELLLLNLSIVGLDAALVQRLRWRMGIATLAMVLAGVGCALLISQGLRHRIARLRIFVEGLVSGPAQTPPP